MRKTRLTKSLYLASRQCDRRVWLEVHAPESGRGPDDAGRLILEQGAEVGQAARQLFPGGAPVRAGGSALQAIEATRALMADETVPAVFEAAFEYRGAEVRVDVLERLDGGRWGLREFKSSTSVKEDQHLPDLAIQKWVLEGCGIELDSVELIHVNPGFVMPGEKIDWRSFFQRVELSDQLPGNLDDDVDDLLERLAASTEPGREPGGFCKKPRLCQFWDRCTDSKTAAWYVDGMRARADWKARVLGSVASDEAWYSEDLDSKLAHAPLPVWSLDFETVSPAIPLFAGTRPYQALVFQWSLHRLGDDGELEHLEFLADGDSDPRAAVVNSLVEALGRDDAPVLVYSAYEKRCLRELAEAFPAHAGALGTISDRLADLLSIVRSSFYHPSLLGSFSIKKVAPILAPEVTYDDLDEVSNGTAAMAAYMRMVRTDLNPDESATLRRALLAYCERDTLAVIEVYRSLCRVAGLSV